MRGSSPPMPVLNLAPSSSPMEQFSNGTAPEHVILQNIPQTQEDMEWSPPPTLWTLRPWPREELGEVLKIF